ncbi:MAG: D-aminoacyl-tRNA deacylase [Pseudomonadota bacterium]
MRVVVQRVTRASVSVDDKIVGAIGAGLLALVGVAPEDGAAEVDWIADKLLGLRIFPDPDPEPDPDPAGSESDSPANNAKNMNRSLLDIDGELLLVSQFTLTADTRRGRRPSFTSAAAPAHAEQIYQQLVDVLKPRVPLQTGEFGADMQVELVNDGPVTFLLERP